MLFVAAATMMAFIACGEKDNQEDNNNNNNQQVAPAEAAANTLVVAGTTYRLECHFAYDSSGRGYVDAVSVEKNEEGDDLYSLRGDAETYNRTFDLTAYTSDADYAFGVNNIDGFGFQQDNHVECEPHFYGVVNGQEYADGAFQSGTLTISKTDDLLTYKLGGVLRNGTAVAFHVSVPASEWQALPW